jgi:hypothetical protein
MMRVAQRGRCFLFAPDTSINKSEIFPEKINERLWQGVEDYDWLVGARDDGFGDGD